MKRTVLILLFITMPASVAPASSYGADGLITVGSNHSVEVTIDRLEKALNAKGMTVFARVLHDEGAARVGLSLRPTVLLIFGNPKVGTLLMLSDQRAAIDLPMKALVWEAPDSTVWLTYNDPAYIASRHGVTDRGKAVKKMQGALRSFIAAATR